MKPTVMQIWQAAKVCEDIKSTLGNRNVVALEIRQVIVI